MLKSLVIFVYAALAYVLAIVGIAWIAGFIAGIGVPKSINDGPVGPVWLAILVDTGLIAAFGLHHSVTARRWFKALWTRAVPSVIERSTYLLMTVAMTAVLIGFWRPIPITLWQAEGAVLALGIRLAFGCVVFMMVLSTFELGHFDFLGVAAAWRRLRRRPAARVKFTARWFYGLVRHPISFGWMLLPWLVPHMTVGQAVFGLGVIVYVLLATPFEEADLEAELGATYRSYRNKVPRFLPNPFRSGASANPASRLRPGRRKSD